MPGGSLARGRRGRLDAPRTGTSNNHAPRIKTKVVWINPMPANGNTLPIINSLLLTGVAISNSMLPRSRSRTIETPVNITMVIVRMMPIRPGTMLIAERRSGL